jgi:hypothetical protein
MIQLVLSSRINFVVWKGQVGSNTRMVHLEIKATYSCTSTPSFGTLEKVSSKDESLSFTKVEASLLLSIAPVGNSTRIHSLVKFDEDRKV